MPLAIRKILIANRGEIAVRILRTAKEMGLQTVAVYSEADRDALHVRMADEAFLLGPASPAQSYLNIEKLIHIAKRSGADAVHPGYGFLAENASFARAVEKAGSIWIGPHPDAIETMGEKVRARAAMAAAGVPVVPGSTEALADSKAAHEAAQRFGLPLALKASGGGGGKGLKIARTAGEVASAFTTAQREARAYFGNGTIYAERYLDNPKHIELQILADKHGNVVHLGERDCSLQRRHQKLWEETPARIPEGVRNGLREAGIAAARAIDYDNAGTIEFLVSGNDFYFLEMNTRIQVEHTVTEMVTGLDLVHEQIRVACGERLAFDQDAVAFRGHAIEGRVNAEDPAHGFRPAPGLLKTYREPAGPGVRVDSAAFQGLIVAPEYDSLIAKLIVWAPSRDGAIARMRRAIDEYTIEGVPTTLPMLRALCDAPAVLDASYGTATLEPLAGTLTFTNSAVGEPAPEPARESPEEIRVEVNDKLYRVRLIDLPNATRSPTRKTPPRAPSRKRHAAASGDDVLSPMHGVVVELSVRAEQAVVDGQVVAVIEAMKMMNEIRAHKSGVVSRLHVKHGDTVEAQSPLLAIT